MPATKYARMACYRYRNIRCESVILLLISAFVVDMSIAEGPALLDPLRLQTRIKGLTSVFE